MKYSNGSDTKIGNDILQKIINEEGSCSGWACKRICELCPMSKLKQRSDGNWLSCADAVGVNDMTEEESDVRYKEIATRLLLNEAIEDLLAK